MGLDRQGVLVLEKGPEIIQAIRQFYPDKKMTLANYKNLPVETFGVLESFPDLTKSETLDYFADIISKYQINYHLNSEVSKVTPERDYFRIQVNQAELRAKVCAIGIGILGRPNKPDFKLPVKLRKQILFDLTSQPVKNEKVLVVGGGDTSSEYCQILFQENCELTLCYRSEDFHRMMPVNREAVLKMEASKQLKILRSCEIQEIVDDGGRPKVLFKKPEQFPAESFDKIIFAIGGSTPVNFLKTMGLEFDEQNWVKVGPDGETNIPNLFLIGDLAVSKTGGSIITAYNSSYRSAKRILQSLLRDREQQQTQESR